MHKKSLSKKSFSKIGFLFFWACPLLRKGRGIPHYASLRCFANATHCLTASAKPHTPRLYSLP
ncbi:MAG: hypothetical protein RML94_16255 [Bacteroidia bacterium]|nr:hypothetical protein [Bacteroidia bacterium]